MTDVPEAKEPECAHTVLAQHWPDSRDMGKAALATYSCESCGLTFSYAQAQQFLTKPPTIVTSLPREPTDDAGH